MRNRYPSEIIRGLPLSKPGKGVRPRGVDLPCDDGEPMETLWHRNEMYMLIETLTLHWEQRTDFFIGGNMFVYFSGKQEFNKDFRGPDFFVVNGGVEVGKERLSWVSWEENDRLPDLIIELVSKTTGVIDRGEKLKLYTKRLKVHEYFCYDPADELLEGWRRTTSGKYVTIDAEPDGSMWSEETQLYLSRWTGEFLRMNGRWLRFFTKDGSMLPLSCEIAAATIRHADAAETEVAKLKRELAALRKKKKK
jgi:Uma2 family endonuclease